MVEKIHIARLTRKGDAKDEDDDGNHEDQCGNPSYTPDVIKVYCRIARSPICFCLNIIFGEFGSRDLPFSILRWLLVVMFLWRVVPVGWGKIEL